MRKLGRRKTIMLSCVIGIIGVIAALVMNFWMQMTGKFIFGFSCGLIKTTVPRFVIETIPKEIYDRISPFFKQGISVGTILAYSTVYLLPEEWKLVLVYFPLGVYLIILVAHLTIFKYDSITFLV